MRSTCLCLMLSVLVAPAEKLQLVASTGPVVHLANGALRGKVQVRLATDFGPLRHFNLAHPLS
jgi:hypothetical protein